MPSTLKHYRQVFMSRTRLVMLGMFLTLVISGCGSDSQPQLEPTQSPISQTNSTTQTILLPTSTPINHPLILEFTPAPVNLPSTIETPVPAPLYKPRLPADSFPSLVQSVNDLEFNGLFESTGSITISEDKIKLAASNGDTSLIVYRLPEAMEALAERKFAGGVRLKDTSDISSMKRETWIYDADGLVFSEIIQTVEEPLTIGITNDLSLTQNTADETRTSAVAAQLVLTGPSQMAIPLPLSTPVSVITDSGEFQMFLENSSFHYPSPNSTDGIAAYNTHLWVLRLK
jgi:hypothetical protein